MEGTVIRQTSSFTRVCHKARGRSGSRSRRKRRRLDSAKTNTTSSVQITVLCSPLSAVQLSEGVGGKIATTEDYDRLTVAGPMHTAGLPCLSLHSSAPSLHPQQRASLPIQPVQPTERRSLQSCRLAQNVHNPLNKRSEQKGLMFRAREPQTCFLLRE